MSVHQVASQLAPNSAIALSEYKIRDRTEISVGVQIKLQDCHVTPLGTGHFAGQPQLDVLL